MDTINPFDRQYPDLTAAEETSLRLHMAQDRNRFVIYCPNCDAEFPARVAMGEEWECQECGDSGTAKARF